MYLHRKATKASKFFHTLVSSLTKTVSKIPASSLERSTTLRLTGYPAHTIVNLKILIILLWVSMSINCIIPCVTHTMLLSFILWELPCRVYFANFIYFTGINHSQLVHLVCGQSSQFYLYRNKGTYVISVSSQVSCYPRKVSSGETPRRGFVGCAHFGLAVHFQLALQGGYSNLLFLGQLTHIHTPHFPHPYQYLALWRLTHCCQYKDSGVLTNNYS